MLQNEVPYARFSQVLHFKQKEDSLTVLHKALCHSARRQRHQRRGSLRIPIRFSKIISFSEFFFVNPRDAYHKPIAVLDENFTKFTIAAEETFDITLLHSVGKSTNVNASSHGILEKE